MEFRKTVSKNKKHSTYSSICIPVFMPETMGVQEKALLKRPGPRGPGGSGLRHSVGATQRDGMGREEGGGFRMGFLLKI